MVISKDLNYHLSAPQWVSDVRSVKCIRYRCYPNMCIVSRKNGFILLTVMIEQIKSTNQYFSDHFMKKRETASICLCYFYLLIIQLQDRCWWAKSSVWREQCCTDKYQSFLGYTRKNGAPKKGLTRLPPFKKEKKY